MCTIATKPNIYVSFLKGWLVKKFRLCAALACEESNFLNLKFEYLCKIEFLRKTILACLSGAQMGSIHEKQIEVENLVTLPL